MGVTLIRARSLCHRHPSGGGSHTWVPRPRLADAGLGPGAGPRPGGRAYSHMGFSCPMSSSFVHFAHSFLSVLMEQRMGPQGLPQSSMAGTLR